MGLTAEERRFAAQGGKAHGWDLRRFFGPTTKWHTPGLKEAAGKCFVAEVKKGGFALGKQVAAANKPQVLRLRLSR